MIEGLDPQFLGCLTRTIRVKCFLRRDLKDCSGNPLHTNVCPLKWISIEYKVTPPNSVDSSDPDL